jgi:crossover junction endodeoxyribonuclease RusA
MLLEFTVPGPPVSHQSRNKAKLGDWRDNVRSVAAKAWGSQPPLESDLAILVAYFHEGQAVRIDNDNMLKPIQDALIDLVYTDDRWITHTIVQKTSIDGSFQIRRRSRVLLEGFSQGIPFLYIVVDHAAGRENLPGVIS